MHHQEVESWQEGADQEQDTGNHQWPKVRILICNDKLKDEESQVEEDAHVETYALRSNWIYLCLEYVVFKLL